MKPFPFRDQNEEQRIYSYRLSRARRVIENSFGILCSKFLVFQKPIALHPDKVENVVLACVVLHNMMRRDYSEHYIQPGLADEENVTAGRVIAGSWRDVHQPMDITQADQRIKMQKKFVKSSWNTSTMKVPCRGSVECAV